VFVIVMSAYSGKVYRNSKSETVNVLYSEMGSIGTALFNLTHGSGGKCY